MLDVNVPEERKERKASPDFASFLVPAIELGDDDHNEIS